MGKINLDVRDKKILFELDKNSRISLTKIAKKLKTSKEVVFHRINNLKKRDIILRFQAVISTYRLGYQSFKIYFKLQNMDQDIRVKMQDYFNKDNSIYWVAYCQGTWDLIIGLWAKSNQEFGEFEDRFMSKFSKHIQAKEVTLTRKTYQYNRRWFYHDNIEPIVMTFGEELEKIDLGDIDFEILRFLSSNSRIKITELSKKLNSTINIVKYRLSHLEKKKVIIGYKYLLNSKLLGYETCKSFINFKNITNERRDKLIEYCKMNPNIINIVLCIGSWEMEIEMEVENFHDYYSIMNDIQEKYNDIINNYNSVIFTSESKQSYMPGAY